MNVIAEIKKNHQYRELLFQLVSRDIKLKYRRSVLGYIWSILNPLMVMIVMTIVFSSMFNRGIKNFPVYLLAGNILFTYMTGATNRALFSILVNASLLRKIYVPKYIFTLAAVTSELITMVFSLGALVIVMVATRVHFTWHFLLIIIPILELYVFTLGLGLFLAQAMVFFRDIQYIWSVICTAWTYLTPIFYPIEFLPDWLRRLVMRFNPMYYYITVFRNFTLNETAVWLPNIWYGALIAALMLLIGAWTFSWHKNKFILYF
jgi:lipopolysaccharide transport system permease protein